MRHLTTALFGPMHADFPTACHQTLDAWGAEVSAQVCTAPAYGNQELMGGNGDRTSEPLAVIETLDELTELIEGNPNVYLRYSEGPEQDTGEAGSRDYEADVVMPGLSVTPIVPEPWWPRPAADWVARRIRQYAELGDQAGRYAWILTGNVVGRGPDHEPLVEDIEPIARLSGDVLQQAARRYREKFDVGKASNDEG
jgi:Family of unknown function (DUF6098)